METIHALKNYGSVTTDIKFFQEAYVLIGLGWIYAPTKISIFDKFIEFIYGIWANNRLKLTFRPSIKYYLLKTVVKSLKLYKELFCLF